MSARLPRGYGWRKRWRQRWDLFLGRPERLPLRPAHDARNPARLVHRVGNEELFWAREARLAGERERALAPVGGDAEEDSWPLPGGSEKPPAPLSEEPLVGCRLSSGTCHLLRRGSLAVVTLPGHAAEGRLVRIEVVAGLSARFTAAVRDGDRFAHRTFWIDSKWLCDRSDRPALRALLPGAWMDAPAGEDGRAA